MTKQEQISNAEVACLYFKGNKCSVCSYLEPKVQELIASSFPKMDFISINPEEDPKLAADYRVFSAPVIIILFDGKETIRKGSTTSLSELQHDINRYYDLYYS